METDHVALLWKPEGKHIRCFLCNRHCLIPDGQVGNCGVRMNKSGKLIATTYGRPCSIAVDPIEKKPFNHFWPGSRALSIATVGCNFHCGFCQNWTISQAKPGDFPFPFVSPDQVVNMISENKCQGMAYTYTEPTVFFEYCNDIAVPAHKRDFYNVFVTNGYMTQEMLKLSPWMDAANVDVKGFSDKFYMDICGGAKLQPILDNIVWMHKHKIHVEVTMLLVPGLNDNKDELRAFAEWLAGVSKDIPLHFSQFHPDYKMMDRPITPTKTLEMAYKIAKDAGIRYVYVGNVPGHDKESTYCYNCGHKLMHRVGFSVLKSELQKTTSGYKCPECGKKILVIGNVMV